MNDIVISLQGLTKRFGDLTAVRAVTFEVKRGEIFGFVGANGGGKTTTIKMLCGILEPTGGSAQVAGFDVATQADKVRQHIGYMSQKVSLYPNLRVIENVRFYGGAYTIDRTDLVNRYHALSERLSLKKYEMSIVRDLPAGIKQRVALCCSILHRPEIVFLDEPTGGADVLSRRIFWDLIQEMAQEGVTVFVTSHYMDEMEFCQSIGMIDQGELIAFGNPQAIKAEAMGGWRLQVFDRLNQSLDNLVENLKREYRTELEDGKLYVYLPDIEQNTLEQFSSRLHNLRSTLTYALALADIGSVFRGMILKRRQEQEAVKS